MTFVLDAGALIGHERNDRQVGVFINRALTDGEALVVPAGVLAQVWREGRRQVRIARLLNLKSVEVVPLDARGAKAVGRLLGGSGTNDVVDASIIWCAHLNDAVVITTDPDDLRRIDPRVPLRTV